MGHLAGIVRMEVLVKFDSEDTAETAVPQQTLPEPVLSDALTGWGAGPRLNQKRLDRAPGPCNGSMGPV